MMENQIVVSEYNPIQQALAELQEKYGTVIPDRSTKESYEYSKKVASECRSIRSNLESVRKDKKKYYLDYGRAIDSQAKAIVEAVKAIEDPHSEAYKAKDAERKAILEARKQKISDLKNIGQWAFDKTESEIEAKLEDIQDMEISSDQSSFGRLADEAANAQSFAVEALHKAHADAVNRRIEEEKREAERLELEALRAEQAKREEEERQRLAAEAEEKRKREEAERLEAAKKEAAEQAKREAEQAKLKAEQEAEAARKAQAEAEERARVEAEQAKRREIEAKAKAEKEAKEAAERAAQAERDRIEQERLAAEEEARKREADEQHRGTINRAAIDALVEGGLTEKQATRAIELIAMKQVPAVSISY